MVEGTKVQFSVLVEAASEVGRVARSALFATPVTSAALRCGGGPPGRHALQSRRTTLEPLTTGAKSGGRIEIVDGLKSGEQIAGKNAFLLKSELSRGEAEH